MKLLSVIGNILTLFPLPKTFSDLLFLKSLTFKFVNSETLRPDEYKISIIVLSLISLDVDPHDGKKEAEEMEKLLLKFLLFCFQ